MCYQAQLGQQERRLLAEAGHISYADLLPVLDKLAKEESYLVVSAVSQVISALERFIDEGTEAERAFKELVAKLARHNYDRLGFEAKDGESDEDELVRQLAVSMMIRSNDAEASQVASQNLRSSQGSACRPSSSHPLTSSHQ